jgi:hypothetical protein
MDSRSLAALLAVLFVAGCGGGGSSSPAAATPTTTLPPSVTETRVGTVQGHDLAWVNFQTSQAGLVTLRIDPILFLTLRAGNCPETCGAIIAVSDNGSLTFQTPSGTNSVLIGNPFDDRKSFTLTIVHPQ